MAKRRVARSRNTSSATKRDEAVIPVTTHLPHLVGVLMHANIVPDTCPHYRSAIVHARTRTLVPNVHNVPRDQQRDRLSSGLFLIHDARVQAVHPW